MPKRSRKQRLPDPNLTAFAIVQAIAGEHEAAPAPDDGKDPAAVSLGRKGTEPFSAGDHDISRIATSRDSTGNATQWVSWCMSHHFESVVDQILNHPEL